MSKIVIFLLIFLLQLAVFPLSVFASEDCSAVVSGNITYEPRAFDPPAAGTNLTLNFTINNDTAYDNFLKGKSVRLHYILTFFPGVGDYNTPEVTIPVDNKTFSIPLTGDSKMISAGEHEAVLDLVISSNRHEEYCKGIKYIVSDPYACFIDSALQTSIPPNNKLTIKFSGKPNTQYSLSAAPAGQFYISILATTDSSGQGQFLDAPIAGSNGDTAHLLVGVEDLVALIKSGRHVLCSRDIEISAAAPAPKDPAPGPVTTPPPGTTAETAKIKVCTKGDPTCTIGGGDACDGGKGIKTAIGCIHTDPGGFVKDFLSFAVGISGGLAFLIMLLGAFQMITSAGNPEALQAGRDRFSSAIIGLLMVIFAVLLLKIIGVDILGLGEQFGFK